MAYVVLVLSLLFVFLRLREVHLSPGTKLALNFIVCAILVSAVSHENLVSVAEHQEDFAEHRAETNLDDALFALFGEPEKIEQMAHKTPRPLARPIRQQRPMASPPDPDQVFAAILNNDFDLAWSNIVQLSSEGDVPGELRKHFEIQALRQIRRIREDNRHARYRGYKLLVALQPEVSDYFEKLEQYRPQ